MMLLVKLMKAQGLSQNRLAAKAELTPSDLSKIVNRRMVPYPSQLRKLAGALGIQVEAGASLMEEVPDPEPATATTQA